MIVWKSEKSFLPLGMRVHRNDAINSAINHASHSMAFVSSIIPPGSKEKEDPSWKEAAEKKKECRKNA